jgi:HD superfamily phosphohydrolase
LPRRRRNPKKPEAYWEFSVIRDPLYGFVEVTEKERKLLNTGVLHRLSRIKQLGHSYIVYPSAVHTRLEHSLGALHVSSRICDRLKLDDLSKEVVRIAALLHDVGHGPFSHIFEDVMRHVNGDEFSHEAVTQLLIRSDEVQDIIGGTLCDKVIRLLNDNSIESEIVSGSVDADKLDYLRRDTYHVGVAYGVFDLERVIRTVTRATQPEREYLAIQDKGADALEAYRLARYSMHVQVYEHHTRLIAEDMFLRSLKLAFDENALCESDFRVSSQRSFLKRYVSLDDSTIQTMIMQKSRSKSKKLIEDIQRRHLFKRGYWTRISEENIPDPLARLRLTEMTPDNVETITNEIAKDAHVDRDFVIVHPQSTKIRLYERFEEAIGQKETPILIKKRNGDIRWLEQTSPISASLEKIRNLYVFCPEIHKRRVGKVAERIFRVENMMTH